MPPSQPPPLRGRAAVAASRARDFSPAAAGNASSRVVRNRRGFPPRSKTSSARLRWSLGYAAAGRDASPSNPSRAQVFFVRLCRSRRLARTSNTSRRFSSRNFARRWRRRWKSPGENLRARRRAPPSNRPPRSDVNPRRWVEETEETEETSATTIVRVSLARAGVAEDAVQRTISSSSKEARRRPLGGSSKTSVDVSSRHALGWVEGVETGGSRGGRDVVSATGGASTRLRVRVCLVERPGSVVSGSRGTAAVR